MFALQNVHCIVFVVTSNFDFEDYLYQDTALSLGFQIKTLERLENIEIFGQNGGQFWNMFNKTFRPSILAKLKKFVKIK